MSTIHWKTEKRNIDDLIPAEYNPRKASAAEERSLVESIEEFGTVVPIVINIGSRANIIIGGHFRTRLYKKQGITEVDVLVPDRELTLEEEMRLNLRLNKNMGSWDAGKLHTNFDLDTLLSVGFGDDDLRALWDDVNILDDEENPRGEGEPEEPVIPRMAVGDIFQLGNHKVMLGDAANPDHVYALMGEEKADMIYCDPPYGMEEGYEDLVKFSLQNAVASAKADSHFFYWTDEQNIHTIHDLYLDMEVSPKRVCMWIKNTFNLSPKIAFNRCYEPCVYGTRGTPYLDKRYNKMTEILNVAVDSGSGVHDEVMDLLNIWLVRREMTPESDHPTQKPVTLHQKPLRRCTAPGHIVLDLFGGSGSTMMACEQMERKARTMEIDPVYCEKILRRWESFTGLKAIRI